MSSLTTGEVHEAELGSKFLNPTATFDLAAPSVDPYRKLVMASNLLAVQLLLFPSGVFCKED